MRSSQMRRPTPTNGSSIGYSPRPPTPSAWRTIGSISRVSARPTAFSTITTTACSGRGAIGSSSRSLATGHSTSSARGSSPATCCRTRRASRSSRPRILRVGKRTTENGAIDAEYKAEYMVERTDNALGIAFLGLTVGCARCHDHKYDPIKQTRLLLARRILQQQRRAGCVRAGVQRHSRRPDVAVARRYNCRGPAGRGGRSRRENGRYAAAQTAAAEPRARRQRRAWPPSPTDAAARIRTTLADALAAHYEFESARPAQLADLPPPRTPHIPPAALTEFRRNPFSGPPPPPNETAEQRRQREAPSSRSVCRVTTTPSR